MANNVLKGWGLDNVIDFEVYTPDRYLIRNNFNADPYADQHTETMTKVVGLTAGIAGYWYGAESAMAESNGATSAAAGEAPQGPIGCFPAGTPILLADGSSESIESVRPGDVVLAHDVTTGRNTECRVLKAYVTSNRNFVTVATESGELVSTQHHPYWVAAVSDWVRAVDLVPGDLLLLADGSNLAVSGIHITELPAAEETFNLEVEGCHCYYAGTLRILVHNGPGLDAPGYQNYRLVDASGKTYYHGQVGPDASRAAIEYRHANTANRFNPANGDVLKVEPGFRTYGEARRMEHEGILRDGTLLDDRAGANAGNYRGNRQSGIGEGNIETYYPAC
jgi:hypothetical protein